MGENEEQEVSHYNFDNLYADATMLDTHFIRDEAGFDLSPFGLTERKIFFRNYYVNICIAISSPKFCFITPTTKEIEQFLQDGFIENDRGFIQSKIETTAERKYMFLMAQARQLQFDKANGRTSMLRNEDKEWILSDDTSNLLNALGLKNNGTFFL